MPGNICCNRHGTDVIVAITLKGPTLTLIRTGKTGHPFDKSHLKARGNPSDESLQSRNPSDLKFKRFCLLLG